jgi:phosphoglycerate dehydrogenase-like enzyme
MRVEEVVVASQLGRDIDERLEAAFPALRIVPVAAGFPTELPPTANVLFAAPFRSGTPIFPPAASWVERVRWIQLLTAGADGYPPWYFDVPELTCSRGPTARPVAEFALAAIFAHAKGMPQVWIRDASDWKPQPLGMLHGATLGIVGFGAIGRTLATLALGLGMRVLVSRRSHGPIPDMDAVIPVGLKQLMRESDHVVLAAAATPDTRHLIGRSALRDAKTGLHLVNIARGSLLDQDALLEALDDGRIACASLDVTDPEPLPAGHRLYTHKSVRLSPHLSWYDPTLRARLAQEFIQNMERFLARMPLLNSVDRNLGY